MVKNEKAEAPKMSKAEARVHKARAEGQLAGLEIELSYPSARKDEIGEAIKAKKAEIAKYTKLAR